MTWQIVTVANLGVAACYFAISGIILKGLVQTGQLGRNKLGLATGADLLHLRRAPRLALGAHARCPPSGSTIPRRLRCARRGTGRRRCGT